MNKVQSVEKALNIRIPQKFGAFLENAHNFDLRKNSFPRILEDGSRDPNELCEILTPDNFITCNERREWLFEFQEIFNYPENYVEPKYLYSFGFTHSGAVCIAVDGYHVGKIYSSDSGDYGILYQAEDITEFIDSLYNLDEFLCDYNDFLNAVEYNDLPALKDLIEHKDGKRYLYLNSWLDVKLFQIGLDKRFYHILDYLITKGFTGFNWAQYYSSKYCK